MPNSNRLVSPVTRTKDQARSTYNRISHWYDLFAGGFERQYRDAALRMLAPGDGDIILEIGSGTGLASLSLAESIGSSGRVYGIDISSGMLHIAQSRVRKAGLSERITLMQGDALQLPFVANTFDGIFMSFTLELFDIPEIPQVLSECYRALQSRGRICVVAISKRGKPNPMIRFYEWLHQKIPQYFDCRPIYLQSSLEDAGFQTLDVVEASLLGLRIEIGLSEKASTIYPG